MPSLLSELNWLDEAIRAEMERWQVPGISVGILKDGEVQIAGYGTVNLETGAPVLPETLFQIGSISKTFTATLVLQLVDEGRLDLDVPVITYVPDLPLADDDARRTITLRHLLTHTAGFYGDRFDDQGNGDDALARAVAAYSTLAQQTALSTTAAVSREGGRGAVEEVRIDAFGAAIPGPGVRERRDLRRRCLAAFLFEQHVVVAR